MKGASNATMEDPRLDEAVTVSREAASTWKDMRKDSAKAWDGARHGEKYRTPDLKVSE